MSWKKYYKDVVNRAYGMFSKDALLGLLGVCLLPILIPLILLFTFLECIIDYPHCKDVDFPSAFYILMGVLLVFIPLVVIIISLFL